MQGATTPKAKLRALCCVTATEWSPLEKDNLDNI